MHEGPFLKKIVLYTIPIILTGILQLTFHAADLIIVGQFSKNGSLSVAAIGATSYIINLMVNLFIGLSVGAGVTVAQALGSGQKENVHQAVHTAIPTALVCGGIITLLGITLSEPILKMTETPSDVLPLSSVYMKIYFAGITFLMIYNFGAAILRAAGDTKGPLLYLTCAGIINVLLNTLFVLVFRWDVAGVALATTLSQGVSAGLVVSALRRRADACKLILKDIRFRKKPLLKILRIGIPSGVQGCFSSLSNIFIQYAVNSFGSAVMSGVAAASSLEGFIYTSMISFQQTALNFTGQNAGAGKYNNIKKITFTTLVCVTLFSATFGTLMYLFGEPLLSLYLKNSPSAIGAGMTRLEYISIPYFISGIMDTMAGALRGMGISTTPMIITGMGAIFRIGWVFFLFPHKQTLGMAFVAYPISWVLTSVAEIVIFIILIKRKQKEGDTTAQRIL